MYKEVNPAIFACVSFPFLFGVMFGDMGHGSLLLAFSLFLVIMNDKLKGTALEMAAQIRYLLLLMGIFATYNGLIYNEFFAIPIDFFGSCYKKDTTFDIFRQPIFFERLDSKCVYPVGVDPRWMQSDATLTFTNNMKMKISVILGIT